MRNTSCFGKGMASVLMIIAQRNFRDEELFDTKHELERAHHTCTIASQEAGGCVGSRGGRAVASLALDDVDAGAYDAVVFVGGPGATTLFDDASALAIARSMNAAGKVVGAICIAPTVLANAGVLRGRRATAFPSERDSITAAGAKYAGAGVCVDGNVVTASGPDRAKLFGRELAHTIDASAAHAAE